MAKKRKPRSADHAQMIRDAKRGKVSKSKGVAYLDRDGVKAVLGFNVSMTNARLESSPPINVKPDTKSPTYLNKRCKTEHGIGIVCGIDLPESRAWRLLVKITENTGIKIHEGMFPDSVLAYTIDEVEFLGD